MTLPAPRPGDSPPMGGEYAWGLLVAQLTRVENGVTHLSDEVTRRFDSLPDRFVTRSEYTAFGGASEKDRVELRAILAAETAARESDVRRVDERITSEGRERAGDRKWALGILATVLIALIGFGITLFTHYY